MQSMREIAAVGRIGKIFGKISSIETRDI